MSKEMTLASKQKFLLTDSEAALVSNEMIQGSSKAIRLPRLDITVALASIMLIAPVETFPHYRGNLMDATLTKVFTQGEWKTFAGDKKDIQFLPKTLTSSTKQLT